MPFSLVSDTCSHLHLYTCPLTYRYTYGTLLFSCSESLHMSIFGSCCITLRWVLPYKCRRVSDCRGRHLLGGSHLPCTISRCVVSPSLINSSLGLEFKYWLSTNLLPNLLFFFFLICLFPVVRVYFNHSAAQGKLKTGFVLSSHLLSQDGSVETCYNTNVLKDVLCILR